MNKEFLASTSLFAEMANNKIDLKKIIDEFIISTFVLIKKYSQDSTEIRNNLIQLFDLNIPEAIIRTQLKGLRREGIFDNVNGQYIIDPKAKSAKTHINDNFLKKQKEHSDLFKDLIKFIEWKKGPLNEDQLKKLESTFIEFLFDNNIDDEYAALVSAFIVRNEDRPEFLTALNLIREGATILKGIQYSSDFNDTSIWNDELTMYLDTEHLLSIIGFNGETFKSILYDFYELVRQINAITREKYQKSLIKLKYTSSVRSEVENLFYACKKIVEGNGAVKPGKTAIMSIIEGCETRTDVTQKESKFFSDLKNLNILLADEIDLFENTEFNVVDEKALNKYKDEKEEEEINKILESFTYINILRRGRNNRKFEKIGHIILTGDRITRLMSSDLDVKVEDLDFSFATDIYYVTQKLWYRLNRGLGFTSKLPATLDIVNKAQIIITGQINNNVRQRYEKLLGDVKSGVRKEEEVKDYYLRLRNNTFRPEDINKENILEQIEFIYKKNDLEDYLRNESAKNTKLAERQKKIDELKQTAEQQEKTIRELKEQKIAEAKEKGRKKMKRLKLLLLSGQVFLFFILLLLAFYIKDEKDTFIATISFVFLLMTFLLPFVQSRRIKKHIEIYAYKEYNLIVEE
ncbi:hypothetical protein OQ279_06875 [Salinimicrobium sp. MT39]|uniref:Uncharacterized protein n=1 Tax=Salinimicrobium profundisediminis TaxID=2994553 RepID=A0A9X3I0T5_9FLAO|nr:hypothetical protein [Salinimicrobium profundisediminis]MCX2837874.1 hypothetical protein [Salinimicrobium profundisediminis]